MNKYEKDDKKGKKTPSKNKTSVAQLLSNKKKENQPDKEIIVKINAFVKLLNAKLKKQKINAEASIGGSVAKGTFIKNNFDADIFVKFDKSYKSKKISDILEQVLIKMKIKAFRVHGSRDYFQIKKEFTYELVPVLNVKDYREAENVADMSPLHVNYFMKKTKKIKDLQNEVRLAKVFMKSARVYGAESYIKGFSGHVVDLLIIKYHSFLELVKSASKWKDEIIIDIEKQHIDPKMSLNTSKISGPMIIVDPIQKNRNAAAAVSKECFERFKERCKRFLKNPCEEFFELADFSDIINEKILKTKNANIFLLNISPKEGKRDVIGSKILKIKEHIEQTSNDNDFSIMWSDWEFNEKNSRICFAFDSKILPPTKIIKGPPLEMKESAIQFKKAHKKTFQKEGHVFAEEKRKFISPLDFLKYSITENYIKEKCRSINILPAEKS